MNFTRSPNPLAVLFVIAISANLGLPLPAQAPFTEEGFIRGLSLLTPFGWGGPAFGYGLALNDFDGDGDPDLLVTGVNLGEVRIFENDGTGNFTDRTVGSNLPKSLDYNGVSCADYDRDSDLDVYLSTLSGPNLLLQNNGDFTFTDVTSSSGLGNTGDTTGTCWGDFDSDGWVDLYVVNYAPSAQFGITSINALYRNNGDGTFDEVGAEQGVDDNHAGFQAIFFDHDGDGDVDLYLANDFGNDDPGNHNHLWRNDNGHFVDISGPSGTGAMMSAMGLSAGDFDHDGDFDIFCTDNPPDNLLLMNNGDGTYLDATDLAEVQGNNGRSWGVMFWDFDNDTFEEIFVANQVSTNLLYDFDGTMPFEEIGATLGIDDTGWNSPGASFCCAKADVDGDGDLDAVIQTYNEPIALYINHEGETRNWLRVRLRDADGKLFSVGATALARTGSIVQMKQINAGTGLKSSSEFILHFGLDDALIVETLLIRWPDRLLSLLENVEVNQLLQVDQALMDPVLDCDDNLVPDVWQIAADPGLDLDGDGLLDLCSHRFFRGDSNADQAVDLADAIVTLSHIFSGGEVDCLDAADSNDDGAVDVSDPIYLLAHLFNGAPQPPPPGTNCGFDLTPDANAELGCENTCTP